MLRVALRSALRDGKVYRNVAALVDAPSVQREPVKPFDIEEAKAFDAGNVWIRRALQRQKGAGLVAVAPKSRTSVRPLALPPFVADAFRDQRRRQAEQRLAFGPGWRDEDWVFTMGDGRPTSPDFIDKRLSTPVEN